MSRVPWLLALALAACTSKPPAGPDPHTSGDTQLRALADLVNDAIDRGDASRLQALVPTKDQSLAVCPELKFDDTRRQGWVDDLPKSIATCQAMGARSSNASEPGWDAPKPSQDCDGVSETTLTINEGELVISVSAVFIGSQLGLYKVDCGNTTGG
jgi:hypothetical protein